MTIKVQLPHIMMNFTNIMSEQNVTRPPNIYIYIVCVYIYIFYTCISWYLARDVREPSANLWRFLFTTSSSMILCSTNPMPF